MYPKQTALSISIVTLFEREGLEAAIIAEQLELDILVVKSVLQQYSSKYQELESGIGDESELEKHKGNKEISQQEMTCFMEAYKELARYGESEFLRERALRNLINYGKGVTDGLGESDMRKALKDIASGGNILNLNMVIQNAREAKKGAQKELENILDINAEVPAIEGTK
jgi:hypothetical protein